MPFTESEIPVIGNKLKIPKHPEFRPILQKNFNLNRQVKVTSERVGKQFSMKRVLVSDKDQDQASRTGYTLVLIFRQRKRSSNGQKFETIFVKNYSVSSPKSTSKHCPSCQSINALRTRVCLLEKGMGKIEERVEENHTGIKYLKNMAKRNLLESKKDIKKIREVAKENHKESQKGIQHLSKQFSLLLRALNKPGVTNSNLPQ